MRILHGDCRAVLKTLPENSVHMCCTSPPYWGLRSYLPEGHPDKALEIGSEPTVDEWVATMVAVFREVRRVLRPDGTLWLNLGDSYAARTTGDRGPSTSGKHGYWVNAAINKRIDGREIGLEPKNLIGQPWRVAFALQADGWILRQEIIWSKPNPMPESVRDRCTKAHEHLFLLAKSGRPTIWQARDTGEWSNAPDLDERLPAPTDEDEHATIGRWAARDYFYDFEAMQEPVNGGAHPRTPGNKSHKHTAEYESSGDERHRTKAGLVAYAERQREKYRTPAGWADGETPHTAAAHQTAENHRKVSDEGHGHRVHPRTVGVGHNARPRKAVPNGPKEGLHANDSAYGDGKSARMGRGAGWRERKLAEDDSGTKNNASFDEAMAVMPATRNPRSVWTIASEPFRGAHFATFPSELPTRCIRAGCPPGGTVLDPFGGSGTTGMAADRLQRHAVLIELDERNLPMARERITGEAPLFAEVEAAA